MGEAKAGGVALKEAGYSFDIAHTSLLTRAQVGSGTSWKSPDLLQVTLATVLEQIGQSDLQVEKTWRLNERHYGGLTGDLETTTFHNFCKD